MRKRRYWVLLIATLLVLTGCNLEPENTSEENTGETADTPDQTNVVTENQLGEGFYRPVLSPEETYQPSNSRGITLRLNSGLNIALFEKDLIRLSQSQFPTSNYFIKEGQVLDRDLLNDWLSRATSEDLEADIRAEIAEGSEDLTEEQIVERVEAEKFREGLNPMQTGEDETRAPNYLNSILEFDFYSEDNLNGELPSGMSIGLALNTVDYYSDAEYRQFQQDIAPEVALEQGQLMANKIVSRMRSMEGLENIPILISLYEQSSSDDLAGGVYVAVGESLNGSTSIDDWNMLNEERLIFPLEGTNSAEWNAFANFKSETESFFPNLSGVTGRVHYIDDQLASLSISVMTQFYGEQEIISFTQYLKQAALTYLPMEVDVEILIESPGNVEAFLKKNRTDTDYFSYIFD